MQAVPATASSGQAIPLSERDATSVAEFLKLVPISRSTFYSEVAQGRGPKLIKIRNRTLISRRARLEYIKELEKGARK